MLKLGPCHFINPILSRAELEYLDIHLLGRYSNLISVFECFVVIFFMKKSKHSNINVFYKVLACFVNEG